MATQNNTWNFVRLKGKTKMVKRLFAASVAAEEWAIVYPNGSWALTISDATAWTWFWVIRQTIASTDSDYASTKMVLVEIPVEANVEWLFTVWSWTFTAADVSKAVDLHTDWLSVAVDGTTAPVLIITWYISSTKWKCVLMSWWVQGLPVTT